MPSQARKFVDDVLYDSFSSIYEHVSHFRDLLNVRLNERVGQFNAGKISRIVKIVMDFKDT